MEHCRQHDLGLKLSNAQRERALGLGIREMTWTYDPLQSRNAHFNFAKLGIVSDTYKVDFYGPETSSLLHRNGTDRLWVTWPLRRGGTGCGQTREREARCLRHSCSARELNGDGRPARGPGGIAGAAAGEHRDSWEILDVERTEMDWPRNGVGDAGRSRRRRGGSRRSFAGRFGQGPGVSAGTWDGANLLLETVIGTDTAH